MVRKFLATALFLCGCSVTLYAASADEAPAPRPAEDAKKAEDPKPGGKFGGRFGGRLDPEKLKELKEKFGGKFGGKFDPEKLKELRGRFKKGGGAE